MTASTTAWSQTTAAATANAAAALGRLPAAISTGTASASQMAAVMQSVGGQVQNQFSSISSSGHSFAFQLRSAFSSISEGVSTVAGHIGSMVSSVGSGFVSMGRSVIGAVEGFGRFVFFAKYAAEAAMGFAQALLGQNANMEQSRVAFTGLLGSSSAANDMLQKLWNFAAATPFEFTGLVQNTQELIGMGFTARDVIPVLTAVGDAAAGVGRGKEGVDSITLALGQMQARGKVTGQDMLQMTEAGIPAWKILANAMHLTVAQVQDLSQQGKLGADSVTALWHGMEKMYPKQMENQARTFNGLLSTLHDNAMMALMTFSGPLFNMAKGALSSLTTLAGSPAFSQFAKTLGQNVAQGIAAVVNWIKQAVSWFGQFAPQVAQVQGAFANLGAALAPIAGRMQQANTSGNMLKGALEGLRLIIVGTAAVIAFLANGLATVIRWVQAGGPVIQMLGGIFNQLASVISSSFLPVWKQMQDSWRQLQPAIAPLLPALKVIGEILLGVVVVAVLTVIAILAGLAAALAKVLIGVMQFVTGIVQFFSGMAQACSGAINFITDLVTGKFGRLGADLQEIWQGIALMFQGMWNMIQGIFNAAVMSVIALISTFIGTITGFFVGLYTALVGGSIIPDMCNAIIAAFNAMVAFVIGIVSGFVNSVINFFLNLAARIAATVEIAKLTLIMKFMEMVVRGQALVQSLVDGVSNILGRLGAIASSAASGFINELVAGINNGIGRVGGAVNNLVSTVRNLLPFSPAKEGPLRDLDKFGPALTGGFAAGIRRGIPDVQAAVTMMVSPIPTQVTGRVNASAPSIVAGTRAGGASAASSDTRPIIIRFSERDIVRALMPAAADEIRIHFGGR